MKDFYKNPKTHVTKDGVALVYQDEGDGPKTLLFIHGLSTSLPTWQMNTSMLSRYFRCVSVDLPGHGLSQAGDYSYSIDFYSRQIADLLMSLAGRPLVLVGHSMGGQIALYTALHYSKFIDSLILSATAGFEVFSEQQQQVLLGISSKPLGLSASLPNLISGIQNYFFDTRWPSYESIRKLMEGSLGKTRMLQYDVIGKSIKGMLQYPVFDDLHQLNMPALVIFGENDRLIPNRMFSMETTHDIALKGTGQMPNAKLQLFPNCGHMPHIEAYDRFNLDVHRFLNRNLYPMD